MNEIEALEVYELHKHLLPLIEDPISDQTKWIVKCAEAKGYLDAVKNYREQLIRIEAKLERLEHLSQYCRCSHCGFECVQWLADGATPMEDHYKICIGKKLAEENEALKAEIEAYKSDLKHEMTGTAKLESELQAERARAEKLVEYVVHDGNCKCRGLRWFAQEKHCTCGLSEALADYKQEKSNNSPCQK